MEIKRHLSLFASFHELVSRLQDKASAFGGENRVVIVELRGVAQDLHRRLELVDIGAANFTQQHVNDALHQFQLSIEDRLNNVFSVTQGQIAHQVAVALSTQLAPPEDPRIPSILETLDDLRRA